ncbi:hypothetical protein SCUCBS95973_004103 [Sporothrix curviconia]|uniref:Phytanoyl-CoA dioxygenase n=1 Tax=Sporothrix curviconia TaxID=1260050 RepID=A0ABP0BKX0_9PEZI
MSTTQTVTAAAAPSPAAVDTSIRYGDWRDDLFENGYVVVKQVMSVEKAQYYVDKMLSWLETFPLGFDRKDRSTWTTENLPYHWKEPGVVGAYSKLWGTDNLLVSFDGMNMTIPQEKLPQTEPWPHIDQNPRREGLVCAQGIINFAPNGPRDGGLIVVKGSHRKVGDFFRKNPSIIDRVTWGPKEWFGFSSEEVAWFQDQGCEVVKVCAGPGDLIIWDSRTIHYNALPETDQIRSIVYACYGPASVASKETIQKKKELFEKRKGTPFSDVVETPQVLRLAGVIPYFSH